MEASGADPQTPADAPAPADAVPEAPPASDTPTDQPAAGAPTDPTPTGNGYVVLVGQFEPGSVVTLHSVAGEGVFRAEGAPIVGQRVVDSNEAIGFDGLNVGDRYIAAGYTRGEYREISLTAHDPEGPVEFMQQPVQPNPTSLGTQGTRVRNAPGGEPADDTLEVGLPEGVTSPILGGEGSDASTNEQRADAEVGPGDIEGAVVLGNEGTPLPEPTVEDHQAAEAQARSEQEAAEAIAQEHADAVAAAEKAEADAKAAEDQAAVAKAAEEKAAAEAAEERAKAEAAEAETRASEAAAAAAAAEAAQQPAPDTGSPDTTPSEPGPAQTTDPAPTDAAGGTDPAAQAAPTDEANPPAPTAGTPDASESSGTGQANGGAVEQPDAKAQLTQQAEGLGVENASTLSEDELRQAITEKSVTPVV